jgi:hypothetical protein
VCNFEREQNSGNQRHFFRSMPSMATDLEFWGTGMTTFLFSLVLLSAALVRNRYNILFVPIYLKANPNSNNKPWGFVELDKLSFPDALIQCLAYEDENGHFRYYYFGRNPLIACTWSTWLLHNAGLYSRRLC